VDDSQLAAEFARATKRKRQLRFALLGLVIAAPFGWLGYQHFLAAKHETEREERYRAQAEANKLTAADLPEARRLVAEARRLLDEAAAAWAAVTPASLRTATLRADNCPLTFEAPPPRDKLGEVIRTNGWGGVSGYGWSYQLVEPGGTQLDASPELDAARSGLESFAKLLDAGTGTRTALHLAIRAAEQPGVRVVVLAEQHVRPQLLGNRQFEPGLIAGTAFVYSHARRGVVCAGPIEVHSSELVAADWNTEAALVKDGKNMLEVDLDMEVRRKIAHYLKAAR